MRLRCCTSRSTPSERTGSAAAGRAAAASPGSGSAAAAAAANTAATAAAAATDVDALEAPAPAFTPPAHCCRTRPACRRRPRWPRAPLWARPCGQLHLALGRVSLEKVHLVEHHGQVVGQDLSDHLALGRVRLHALGPVHHQQHAVDDLRPADDGADQARPGRSTSVNWSSLGLCCGGGCCGGCCCRSSSARTCAGIGTLKAEKARSSVMPRALLCGCLSNAAVLSTCESARISDVLPESACPNTPTLTSRGVGGGCCGCWCATCGGCGLRPPSLPEPATSSLRAAAAQVPPPPALVARVAGACI